MNTINCKTRTHFAIQESKSIESAANKIERLLDAKYKWQI